MSMQRRPSVITPIVGMLGFLIMVAMLVTMATPWLLSSEASAAFVEIDPINATPAAGPSDQVVTLAVTPTTEDASTDTTEAKETDESSATATTEVDSSPTAIPDSLENISPHLVPRGFAQLDQWIDGDDVRTTVYASGHELTDP
jgi:hypothetical protein